MMSTKAFFNYDFGSKLVFAKNITKNLLCSVAAIAMLSGCTSTARMGENGNTPTIWQFNDQAAEDANLATVAYSQGNFEEAQRLVDRALQSNPKLLQALIVSAMTAEQLGHYNRARQNYEDIILLNSNDTSILGSTSGKPEKMSDIAQKRLRMITLQQSKMVIEDDNGAKVFNIDDSKALRQSKSAIAKAIFMAQKKKPVVEEQTTEEQIETAEILFDDGEQNVIARFLTLKELAEKDLVTQEEFLNARSANIGALLPMTNSAPAFGIDRAVPSPDLIIERINVLKEATEAKAITPREFSAERNLIIETLLPPHPRQRAKRKLPSKDIMTAAKNLRKLEVLYDLNLITSKEKEKEKAAIENYLGINRAPAQTVEKKTTLSAAQAQKQKEDRAKAEPLVPMVSNPF